MTFAMSFNRVFFMPKQIRTFAALCVQHTLLINLTHLLFPSTACVWLNLTLE